MKFEQRLILLALLLAISIAHAQSADSLPPEIANDVTIYHDGDDVMIQTTAPLHELLTWLANLPLTHLQVEPVGLRAVYEEAALGEAT